MPKLNFKQPWLLGPFNKSKKTIQRFKETGDSRNIYKK